LQLLGLGISGMLVSTVSKLVGLSQAEMEVMAGSITHAKLIRLYGKWVHYDGLKEKQCPGSGLFEQHTAQLETPSHCFYVQLWGTQFRRGL